MKTLKREASNLDESYLDEFDHQPFHEMLGITLVERAPGYGKIMLTRTEETPTGIGGGVHGGVLATLVDIAMTVALFAEMREGEVPAGTADLGITYLRKAQGERIFASASVVKRGRQLSSVEVDITDDRDRLCARGRVLYAFHPPIASMR